MAARYGIIGLALQDPIAPLLPSLACAVAFVACGPETSHRIRPAIIAWWSVIAGALLLAIATVFFKSTPRDVYPVGDHAVLEIGELKRARRQGLGSRSDSARRVQLAAEAVLDEMRRQHVRRPLFRMSTRDWGEAAGVLLQVYKRGVPPAVDVSLVPLFGEPLAPAGLEDRLFLIADATTEAALTRPRGDQVIASLGRMYVHSSPIVEGAATAPRPSESR